MIKNVDCSQAYRNCTSIQRVLKVQWWTLGLVIAIIAVAIFHLAFLLRFPPVFVDEAWMASRAWGWLQSGINFSPLDAGVWDKFEGYWTFYPLVPTLLHAATIQVLGLKVSSLRLLSLLFGFGLLAAVYFISYVFSRSRRCSLITVLLVSTSWPFLRSSHLIRPDIFVATLGFTAILLHLVGCRKERPILSLMAGLLIGLGFEIHMNAAIYGPVLVALFLVDHGWQLVRQRNFWAFVGGTCLGLAWYVWLHILPYPQTYATMGQGVAETHFPPLFSGSPLAMFGSLFETSVFLLAGTLFRMLATLVAAVMLWRERSTAYVKPLTMFVVGTLVFAFLIRSKLPYYLILIAPFSDIVLAIWIEQTLQKSRPTVFRWKAFMYSIVAVSLALGLYLVNLAPPPGDIDLVVNRVKRVMSKDASVMGPQTYWFGLYEHSYLSWQNINGYQRFHPGSNFDDAIQVLRPDILIIDNHLRQFIVADRSDIPRSGFQRYIWERRLRKEDVDTFLARRGKLADRLDTATYGTVDIYSIRWDAKNAIPQ
jgi:4-amino-4-deoxy-L-arabinose transferase-like glycosyltransferase